MKTSLLNSLICLLVFVGLLETGLFLIVEATSSSPPKQRLHSPSKRKSSNKKSENVSKSSRTDSQNPDSMQPSPLPNFSGMTSVPNKKFGRAVARASSGAYLAYTGANISIKWIDHAMKMMRRDDPTEDTVPISMHSTNVRVISALSFHYVFPVYEPVIMMRKDPKYYTLKFPRLPADVYDLILVIRINRTRHAPPRKDMTADQEHEYYKKNKLYEIRPCDVPLPFRVKYQDVLVRIPKRLFIAGDEMQFGITQLADAEDLRFAGSDASARMYLIQMPQNGFDAITPDMTNYIGSFTFASSSPTSRKFACKLPDHISGFHQIIAIQEFTYSKETDIGPGFSLDRPSMSEMGGRFYLVLGRSPPFTVLSKVEDTMSLLRPIDPIPVMESEAPLGFGRFAPNGSIVARQDFLSPTNLYLNRFKLLVNKNHHYNERNQLFADESRMLGIEDERESKGNVSVRTKAYFIPTGKLSAPIIAMSNYYRAYKDHPPMCTTDKPLSAFVQLEVPQYSKAALAFKHKERHSSTPDNPKTTSSLTPKKTRTTSKKDSSSSPPPPPLPPPPLGHHQPAHP